MGSRKLLLELAKPLQVVVAAIIMALLLAKVAICSERAILNGVTRDMTFCTPELALDLLLAFELLKLFLHLCQKTFIGGLFLLRRCELGLKRPLEFESLNLPSNGFQRSVRRGGRRHVLCLCSEEETCVFHLRGQSHKIC